MKTGDNPENIPPKGWPPKEVILGHIVSFIPVSAIVMSSVSKYWHQLFTNHKFWEQVLVRDFGFEPRTLKSIEQKYLKQIYVRLANLDIHNPPFAKWFRRNIIETGGDFSILYATHTNVLPNEAEKLDALFYLALYVSNFQLAKQLMFVMFLNDDQPDYDTVVDLTKFGNVSAVHWLVNTAGVRHLDATASDEESDLDSDEEINEIYRLIKKNKHESLSVLEEPRELAEFSELLETAESKEQPAPKTSLLIHAFESRSLPLIKAEISKASPEQILGACIDVIADESDSDVPGLRTYATEIVKSLIAPALIALQTAGSSLEEARGILYPIAAFTGQVETFTWLEQQLALHHLQAKKDAGFKFEVDPTLMVAISTGKVDLVEWLIDPHGGKLDTTNSDTFDPHNIDVAIRSKNPAMVSWFMSEKGANIALKTAEEVLRMMEQCAEHPELKIILESMLSAIKNKSLAALTDAQLKSVLYTAAGYENIPAVTLLLDPAIGNIQLTREETAALLEKALLTSSVPLLETLTTIESRQKISLDAAVLSRAILRLAEVHNDQDNLPALIHWLTDKEHGNLPVSQNEIDLVKSIASPSYIVKTLVQAILEQAFAAQNKLKFSNK